MTVQTAVLDATERLARAGIADPERNAQVLAAHVLCLGGPGDVAQADGMDEQSAAAYDELVARRADRVPLEHLTGRVAFRGISLDVGPGVFVPQPETESVVQWAVEAARAQGWNAPLMVDLCTGSGTIAFALANEVPGVTVHAVERDPGALAWTRRNAQKRVATGDPEVHLHLGSVEEALHALDGTVHLVASNPPYVATTEAHIPDPEVTGHDPGVALWAGEDGLSVIRLVEQAARRLLRPGGLVVVEHSDRQGRSAPAVFEAAGGWADIDDHQDQDGLDRFVTARWAGETSGSNAA